MNCIKLCGSLLAVLISCPVWAITIVALGDSVTAGYGVSKSEAYPSLLEATIQKKYPKVKVVNAGIPGATTASAISNLKWQLRRPFEILILCLGGNDGLRGLKLSDTKKNLGRAIELAQAKGIKVLLVGMQIPKNYGLAYRKEFQKLYAELAVAYKVAFMPFLLKDVATVKALNLADGIHPNEKGYRKIVENLAPYVEALL